jgi:hypoxanthine phosphoribosyltransferase
MDFIGISSYGNATVSSGVVQITQDLSRPIEGKHVIVVEDIVDTGHTVHYLMENLATRRPKSLKLASLLHKPDRAEREVEIHYLGFTIPNEFVVGYGLDVAQLYRNLPFIGYVTGGAQAAPPPPASVPRGK